MQINSNNGICSFAFICIPRDKNVTLFISLFRMFMLIDPKPTTGCPDYGGNQTTSSYLPTVLDYVEQSRMSVDFPASVYCCLSVSYSLSLVISFVHSLRRGKRLIRSDESELSRIVANVLTKSKHDFFTQECVKWP